MFKSDATWTHGIGATRPLEGRQQRDCLSFPTPMKDSLGNSLWFSVLGAGKMTTSVPAAARVIYIIF